MRRRRGDELHVWPSITDLLAGISLLLLLVLVQSMRDAQIKQGELNHMAEELRRRVVEEERRIGVKRGLVEDMQARLVAEDIKNVRVTPTGVLEIPADLLFDTGKYELKQKNIDDVDHLGKVIIGMLKSDRSRNIASVLVVGHTDSVGGTDRNMVISVKRALAIVSYWRKHFLLSLDTDPGERCVAAKLMSSGAGETQPKIVSPNERNPPLNCENATGEKRGCRANRRVEVRLVPQDDPNAANCGAGAAAKAVPDGREHAAGAPDPHAAADKESPSAAAEGGESRE